MCFSRMVWLLMLLCSISSLVNEVYVYSQSAGDDREALTAFKNAITEDFESCTQSWDNTLVSACTWFHITCDVGNRVTEVQLGGCNLIGSLVKELGNLGELQTLTLYTNALSGPIPSELGKFTHLNILDLHDNFLEGHIPRELGSLSNLINFLLQDNNLNGTVPGELITIIPSIKLVNFTNNLGPGGKKWLTGPCTDQACYSQN